jgi:protein SCO1/2
MPPFSLTNQNGEPISLDTFRGQSFVLTFVFTRCPVPNFCPRMSNNFEELQSAIKTSSDSLAKTQLLSVTLDPAYDTPKVLSDYAAFHHADPKIWTFATGDEKKTSIRFSRVFRLPANRGRRYLTWPRHRPDRSQWNGREDLAGQRLDASGSYSSPQNRK